VRLTTGRSCWAYWRLHGLDGSETDVALTPAHTAVMAAQCILALRRRYPVEVVDTLVAAALDGEQLLGG
jgi:hypothetical protein